MNTILLLSLSLLFPYTLSQTCTNNTKPSKLSDCENLQASK